MQRMSEKFNLKWNTFSSHGREVFQDLMESQRFSDVTLVSDDQYKYEAHKFILSACSSVFQALLVNNPQNPFIYLRGMNHQEVESILQFIYLGEATFSPNRVDNFLEAAKDLNIKEIGPNAIDEERDVAPEKIDTNDTYKIASDHKDEFLVEIDPNVAGNQDIKNDSHKTPEEKGTNAIDLEGYEELISNNTQSCIRPDEEVPSVTSNMWQCELCDKEYTSKGNLKTHVQSIHEGRKFPCQQCDLQASTADTLKTHFQSKHEGKKFPCQQCDYQAAQFRTLQIHIQSRHDGVKFSCQQCDFRGPQRSLRSHVQSKHEGKKFPCLECDYQAAQAGALHNHIQSKHEGIKFPCHLCAYQATQAGNLKAHVQRKHEQNNVNNK